MTARDEAAREAALADWLAAPKLGWSGAAADFRVGWADFASPPAKWWGTARGAYLAGRRAARAYAKAQAKEARP